MSGKPTPVLEGRTVLVTGGTGLVGRAVVRQLLGDGAYVRVQVRSRAAFQELIAGDRPVDVRAVDFTRASERDFAGLVLGCSAVVHTAGLVHQPHEPFEAYELLNVRTTRQLAEAAATAGVESFVFLSTIGVYGPGPFEDVSETEPLSPLTPYAVSKAASERWLSGFDGFRRTVILRPPLVFGEGDRGNLVKMIRQIKSRRYVHIGSRATRKSLIYSQDLAVAISLCLTALGDGQFVFNAANPEPVLLSVLVDTISRCLGGQGGFVTLPKPLVLAGARMAQLLVGKKAPLLVEQIERLLTTTTCSTRRLVQDTGFKPRFSLENALQAEIAWAESERLL